MDMVGGIFPGIVVHDTLGLALERLMKRATDAFPLAPGSQTLEQMRCLVGQGERGFGQRFEAGKLVGHSIDDAPII